eukprot:15366407-Ditylum_brightwellii.AAC.1
MCFTAVISQSTWDGTTLGIVVKVRSEPKKNYQKIHPDQTTINWLRMKCQVGIWAMTGSKNVVIRVSFKKQSVKFENDCDTQWKLAR